MRSNTLFAVATVASMFAAAAGLVLAETVRMQWDRGDMQPDLSAAISARTVQSMLWPVATEIFRKTSDRGFVWTVTAGVAPKDELTTTPDNPCLKVTIGVAGTDPVSEPGLFSPTVWPMAAALTTVNSYYCEVPGDGFGFMKQTDGFDRLGNWFSTAPRRMLDMIQGWDSGVRSYIRTGRVTAG